MHETRVWFVGWEDPLEQEMATHSSILAWKIHGQRSLVGYSSKVSDMTEQPSNSFIDWTTQQPLTTKGHQHTIVLFGLFLSIKLSGQLCRLSFPKMVSAMISFLYNLLSYGLAPPSARNLCWPGSCFDKRLWQIIYNRRWRDRPRGTEVLDVWMKYPHMHGSSVLLAPCGLKTSHSGTFLVVQRLRLHVSNAGGRG